LIETVLFTHNITFHIHTITPNAIPPIVNAKIQTFSNPNFSAPLLLEPKFEWEVCLAMILLITLLALLLILLMALVALLLDEESSVLATLDILEIFEEALDSTEEMEEEALLISVLKCEIEAMTLDDDLDETEKRVSDPPLLTQSLVIPD
jgi:hypothetical protein